MLDLNIPGAQPLRLSHLILDYNGTLACDGSILPGVAERLKIGAYCSKKNPSRLLLLRRLDVLYHHTFPAG